MTSLSELKRRRPIALPEDSARRFQHQLHGQNFVGEWIAEVFTQAVPASAIVMDHAMRHQAPTELPPAAMTAATVAGVAGAGRVACPYPDVPPEQPLEPLLRRQVAPEQALGPPAWS